MSDFDLDTIKYRQARGYNKCEVSRDGDIDSMINEIESLETNLISMEEERDVYESNAQHYQDLSEEFEVDIKELTEERDRYKRNDIKRIEIEGNLHDEIKKIEAERDDFKDKYHTTFDQLGGARIAHGFEKKKIEAERDEYLEIVNKYEDAQGLGIQTIIEQNVKFGVELDWNIKLANDRLHGNLKRDGEIEALTAEVAELRNHIYGEGGCGQKRSELEAEVEMLKRANAVFLDAYSEEKIKKLEAENALMLTVLSESQVELLKSEMRKL